MRRSRFFMEMTLELREDGVAVLDTNGEADRGTWSVSGGTASLGGQTLRLDDEGRLLVEEEGSVMVFVRGDAQEGAAEPAPEGPAGGVDAPADGMQRMGIRFVMTSAEVQGCTLSPAQLGGMEYSLLFGEDGTAEFVLAGTRVPQLPWSQQTVEAGSGQAEAYVIDYYGTPLTAMLTPDGFDMDYLGSMLIHFEAEK